ncbi:MAG: type II toxin-antitoxin system PemK/MazF family toxin [Candidatus Vogelbacteria bacterium]|nr:type II toxin-antitoxin system PemK/MazF family toxin [Candidatus Vogelbacteria bacterium]
MVMSDSVVKTFVAWIKVKIKAHLSERTQFFREGEIWWVHLGYNVGCESNGKNNNFERPILVIKKFNRDSFWGIPMSTQIKAGAYYYTFSLQERRYCLNLSQLRLLSSRRMLRNIDVLTSADMISVRQRIRGFF